MEKLDEQGKPDSGQADGKPLTEEKRCRFRRSRWCLCSMSARLEGETCPSIAVNELSGSAGLPRFFKALSRHPWPIGFETSRAARMGTFICSTTALPSKRHEPVTDHQDGHPRSPMPWLHAIDRPRRPGTEQLPDSRHEVQAESVAYAVCQHYGLDTSEYSHGYVVAGRFRRGNWPN